MKKIILQILLQLRQLRLNKKLLIATALVLLLLLAVFFVVRYKHHQIHDLPQILDSGRLAVLTDSSSLGFSVKGDSVFGFQYELVKAFADTMGLELVVSEENDLKVCMEDLVDGNYDIIASLIPVTTEWKNEVLFTDPLSTSRQVLVQFISADSLAKLPVKKQLDLANDTIYLPQNSPYKMRILNLSNEIASPITVLEIKDKSTEQIVELVAAGKIKNTICDELLARRLKLQYPSIDISLPIGLVQNQAWVVHKKAPKLLQALNDFLNDFIGSSAYWKIYRKYY